MKLGSLGTIGLTACAWLAIGLAPWAAAQAATHKILYSFCAQAGCADGGGPRAGLLMDASGDLFGTTNDGGDIGTDGDREGTVFELIPNARKTKWKYKRLHSFCALKNCADGAEPTASLIMDTSGNLYGTTSYGGVSESGTAFELVFTGRKWKFKLLHAFCAKGTDGCVDGEWPHQGLTYAGASTGTPYDGTSTLYGTTEGGGSFQDSFGFGEGTAFQLSPVEGTKKWKEKVIYSFCSNSGCGTVLPQPSSALLVDGAGNLYGTTGQDRFNGNLFELKPNARRTKWTETTLYNFCTRSNCADGLDPIDDSLILDSAGNLYGTTITGGAHYPASTGGTVFKFDTETSQLSTAYSFCALANCGDGTRPRSGLVMNSSGDLFGTTTEGGDESIDSDGGGTVFKLSGGTLQSIYKFCTQADCADGKDPEAGLIMDASGTLYGTTEDGGANGGGTVFAITP